MLYQSGDTGIPKEWKNKVGQVTQGLGVDLGCPELQVCILSLGFSTQVGWSSADCEFIPQTRKHQLQWASGGIAVAVLHLGQG